MTIALAKPCEGMTVQDLLDIELPMLSHDDQWYMLWEFTGYPCFFAGPEDPINTLKAQLKEVREHLLAGTLNQLDLDYEMESVATEG